MKRREFLSLGTACLVAPAAWSLTTSSKRWEKDFGKFVADGLASTHTPGLGVAIVRAGQTVFTAGYGWADIKSRTPVTTDTAFHVASVSKLVTGCALMLLLEKGAFQLDEPIGRYLDFPVAHPKFPEVPITFRQLFSHTSGISDAVYEKTDGFAVAGDPTLPLRDFLTGYLSPNGHWYVADGSFSAAKPGTEWHYSNVAIALLGYLAGRVGSGPLEILTQQRLFQPLGMGNTAWKIAALCPATLARPYAFAEGELRELPPTGYPDWPAGSLRTSPRDFARFLEIFSNEGVVGSIRYMQPATLRAFLAPQPVSPAPENSSIHQALIWLLRDVNGAHLASHSGGDPGADAVVCLNTEKHTGVLAFANATGSKEFRAFQKEMVLRLLDRAS